MLHYRVKLDAPDDKGVIVVHFPDFEWGVTQGETEEEALDMAADVIEIYLEDCIKNGRPLPKTKKRLGGAYRTLRVPALVAAKAELYEAFRESGMRKVDLARELGIPRMNVDRLFNLKHQSHIDQMEDAFRAVGQEMEITVHAPSRTPGIHVVKRRNRKGPAKPHGRARSRRRTPNAA